MTTAARVISLAAGVVLDVPPADAVAVASAAGYRSVGIWFDPTTWSEQVAREVRRRLDDSGLIALDIEPIMLTPAGDHGDALIDAANAVGAHHVLIASRDNDHARVAARIAQLADRVAGTSITLVLEFLPALGVRTLRDALQIVESIDHPQVGVLVDSLHLSRAGEGPVDVARASAANPHRFPYLQLADAMAEPPGTDVASLIEEALHGRLLPGDGALPLTDLLAAVPDVAVSVELRSRALMTDWPDPVERAVVVLRATTAVLRSG
jgi:sugar phosphate isomerase/epimerase